MSELYSLAPLALDDLDEIHVYVEGVSDEKTADRVIDELYESFSVIGARPGNGHRRTDLTEHDVFFWTALKRYAVIYRKETPIKIVRVIPWRRMEPALLTGARGFRM